MAKSRSVSRPRGRRARDGGHLLQGQAGVKVFLDVLDDGAEPCSGERAVPLLRFRGACGRICHTLSCFSGSAETERAFLAGSRAAPRRFCHKFMTPRRAPPSGRCGGVDELAGQAEFFAVRARRWRPGDCGSAAYQFGVVEHVQHQQRAGRAQQDEVALAAQDRRGERPGGGEAGEGEGGRVRPAAGAHSPTTDDDAALERRANLSAEPGGGTHPTGGRRRYTSITPCPRRGWVGRSGNDAGRRV